MIDLSHILTGTDFSETSKGAVRESLRLASGDPGRRVTLTHVTRAVKDAAALRAKLQQWVQGLPEFVNLHDPSQVTCELEIGKVSTGLSRAAQRLGATIIVVGPLPRTLMERFLTGGVAEQLFHSASIPVLATRGPATNGYRHVLIPVDFGDGSRHAMKLASAVVKDPTMSANNAHLDLLHVAELPGGVHAVGARKELVSSITSDFENQLERFAQEEGVDDLVERSRAVIGVVQDVITKEASACGADLICMASQNAGGLLGSTADAVLRHVQIPLLFTSLGEA